MTASGRRLSLAGAAAVAALAVVADQSTKSWALEALTGREPIHVLGSLQLALSFNTGVAFSMLFTTGLLMGLFRSALVTIGERARPSRRRWVGGDARERADPRVA